MAQEFLNGLEAGPSHNELAGKSVFQVVQPEHLNPDLPPQKLVQILY